MRVVSPDTYQAAGMISLLREFGWTYIVAMNTDNKYSRNGIAHVTRQAAKAGLCILHQWEISSLKDSELDDIVDQLVGIQKIKVIVSFMNEHDVLRFLSAMDRRGNTPKFIFIFSDSLSSLAVIEKVVHFTEDSFTFSLSTGDVSKVSPYYGNISNYLDDENFYHKKFWKDAFGCFIMNGNLYNCTSEPPNEFRVHLYTMTLTDSVYAFAHALDSIIKENECSLKFSRSEIRKCITGKVLLEALSKVVLWKDGNNMTFNENGDMKTNYLIKQIQRTTGGSYMKESVGVYYSANKILKLNKSKLNWSGQIGGSPPDSVCSKPCDKGEYYAKEDIHCCWKCIKCEVTEITADNSSVCRPCPTFSWPDQDTLTTCVMIEAEFVDIGDPYGFILILLTALGAFSCVIVVIVIYKYRKRKLIKASGIPLSVVVLFGDITAFLSVPLLVTKASTGTCYLNHFAFHMSFCISYAPLLCKVNRVCRIFESGKQGSIQTKFISTKSQMIAVTIIYLFQVGRVIYISNVEITFYYF